MYSCVQTQIKHEEDDIMNHTINKLVFLIVFTSQSLNFSEYIIEFVEQYCVSFGVVTFSSLIEDLCAGFGVCCCWVLVWFFFPICSGIPVFLSKKMEIVILIREIFTFLTRFLFSTFSFLCSFGAKLFRC